MDVSPLEELLSRWHRHRDSGKVVPLPELCADHPDLLPPLQQQVDAFCRLEAAPPASSSGVSGPAARADPPAVPGYEVLWLLGQGASGVVYLARQSGLERLVALKVILSP